MPTKEEIDSLKKKALELNNKIISINTKKEIAQKEIQSILEELGYDKDMKLEDIQTLVEDLIRKETQEFNDFKLKVDETEELINSLNLD